MGITLELNPEVHARLAIEARARGLDVATYASRLLDEAAFKSVTPTTKRTPAEAREWLDELAKFSDLVPPMPDETFSREMIYRERG